MIVVAIVVIITCSDGPVSTQVHHIHTHPTPHQHTHTHAHH
jgi:hypothetical protein